MRCECGNVSKIGEECIVDPSRIREDIRGCVHASSDGYRRCSGFKPKAMYLGQSVPGTWFPGVCRPWLCGTGMIPNTGTRNIEVDFPCFFPSLNEAGDMKPRCKHFHTAIQQWDGLAV
jgi:hypothetical protein